MNLLIIAVVVLIEAHLSSGDSSLCTITKQSEGDEEKLPILPEQFQTHIEHNFKSGQLNYTTEYDEYYDFVNKRATIARYKDYKVTNQYFLYDTNELITITDQICEVIQLNTSQGNNPFGLLTINGTLSQNSPSYVLKFGFNFNFTKYEGVDIARGINVRKWSSCIYIDEIKTTVKATWTWSDPGRWQTSYPLFEFPIEMTVESLSDSGLASIETYEYTKYRPYITANPSIFETPVGVYCNGRKATKPLPKVPNHFSYRIEANLVEYNKTTAQTEWYDFEAQLARFDYQPLTALEELIAGKDKISEIHDFNGGIRYIIDKKEEKCLNITTLDPYSVDTGFANSSSYVRIRTALEMFHFDKVEYQYQGSRKVRDIHCDVWIAKRDDWPPQPGQNVTSYWEWAFSDSNWTMINSNGPQYNVPVQLTIQKITSKNQVFVKQTTIYNYFDFKSQKPDIFDFGLEACFEDVESKHLMVVFKNVGHDLIPDKHEFKYQVLKTIANLTYVLPTRIDQVQLDFQDGDTIAEFKLLEKSSVHGNVANPVSQMNLKDAYILLRDKVDSGDFRFTTDQKTFVAASGSLKNVIRADKTESAFSPVVIVSIFIAGLIGIFIGIMGLFVVNKIRGLKSKDEPISMTGLMHR